MGNSSLADQRLERLPDIRVATKTLNNDQIKAIPSHPFVLVPATEIINYAGNFQQVPLPLFVTFQVNASGGAYADVNNNIVVGLSSVANDTTPITSSAHSTGKPVKDCLGAAGENFSVQLPFVGSPPIVDGAVHDNALALIVDNVNVPDFTGGHADNFMTVTLIYAVIDVT